jgi:hypothetical protein
MHPDSVLSKIEKEADGTLTIHLTNGQVSLPPDLIA